VGTARHLKRGVGVVEITGCMGEKADAGRFVLRGCQQLEAHGQCSRHRKFLHGRLGEGFRLSSHGLAEVGRRHRWMLVGPSVWDESAWIPPIPPVSMPRASCSSRLVAGLSSLQACSVTADG
jgi:hypothetical protein